MLQELKVRRLYVVNQLKELQDKVQPILDIMGNDDVMQNMENMSDSKTLINYLSKEFKVMLLFLFVKFLFTPYIYSLKSK